MTADPDTINRDIMISTLEELGLTYLRNHDFEDAEHVFGIILRTGRDKFTDALLFHDTMYRASTVLQKLKMGFGDAKAAKKFGELVDYHENAKNDSVKIETMFKNFSTDEDNHFDEGDDMSSFVSDSISCGSDDHHLHTLSFE